MDDIITYDNLIKYTISEIIIENKDILSIAIQNRNKFEGYLKFELANKLQNLKLKNVTVETKYERKRERYDLAFTNNEYFIYIELITPNVNMLYFKKHTII